ncbi:MAG: DUF1801 domain-containing protein [Thermoactinospora sp.]|nr:DUF1801 domain-containing protein [Thermoactinospora sp.]
MNNAIEQYIAQLPAHQQEIVEALRTVAASAAPGASEVIHYGSPAWRITKGHIAIVRPSKAHVLLAFDRGADFTDGHGLLEGSGSRSRHVKLKSLDDVDERALRDYFTQAVENVVR